jgi:hypothetical protein
MSIELSQGKLILSTDDTTYDMQSFKCHLKRINNVNVLLVFVKLLSIVFFSIDEMEKSGLKPQGQE